MAGARDSGVTLTSRGWRHDARAATQALTTV
jgi:hypothetical protein